MDKNPADRPSTTEILQMPYIRERLQAAAELDNISC